MKLNIILSGLLLASSLLSVAQTSKEEIFETPEKAGAVYYAYPFNDLSEPTVPKGYVPFYISHFGRHGSRYLIDDKDYKWVLDLMRDANSKNALTQLGKDALTRLEHVWVEAEGHGGDLTPLGVRQQKDIAYRMYNNYPEVFKGKVKMSARSTIIGRCILSMDAFCEGLKEKNPLLDIKRESSNKYMSYLNYHSDESNEFTGQDGVWREEYRKFEEKHSDGNRLAKSLFSDDDYILKNVNPSQLLWGFYWIAVDMQNMETKEDFFDLLEKEELFNLWQVFNFRFYVTDSNYSASNGLLLNNTKPALRNIIESAEEVIRENRTGGTFRFAHDGNLIPLTGLLGLEDCYNKESNPYEVYRKFVSYKIAPMAGNIQIIFFKNKKNKNDILVKFMLNEKETSIPIKTDLFPFYRWSEVKSYYEKEVLRAN